VIKEIITNRFIKALPKQKFQNFVNIIRIMDIKEQLTKEKQLEELRENIRVRRKDLDKIIV
jgi:hypothetical protein